MPPVAENAPSPSVSAKDALVAVDAAASSAAASPEETAAAVAGDTAKPASPEAAGTTAPTIAETGTPGSPQPSAATQTTEAPEHRIQAAVRNARNDTVRNVFQQIGVDVTPETFRETVAQLKAERGVISRLRADPRQFLKDLAGELGMSGAEPTTPEAKEPEPDLVSEDGKLRTFSQERLAQYVKFHQDKLMASIRGEFAPVVDGYKRQQSEAQQQSALAENNAIAAQVLTEARALPHFRENEMAIKQRLGDMDPAYIQRVGPVAAMHMAYNLVLRDVVLPGLDAKAQQKVRDEFKRKAQAGNGSVRPGASGQESQPPQLRNAADLAAHMRRKAEAMESTG